MKPGWTAGVTRARLLLGRAVGPEHAREVARAPSLAEALAALAGSAYGERVRAGQDLATAQRGIADTLLWHLRILAGWLPAAGGALVRALAGVVRTGEHRRPSGRAGQRRPRASAVRARDARHGVGRG